MENQKPPFNRRKFLLNSAKVGAAGVLGYVLYAGRKEAISKVDPAPPPAAEPTTHDFLTQPILTSLVQGEMTIQWITRKKSYSWVEYGLTKDLGQVAEHVMDGLTDANDRIHTITFKNLKPGTTYFYRICSKEIESFAREEEIEFGKTIKSETYSFNSIDTSKNEWSWLIMNDVHDRPESINLLYNIANTKADFIFINGDIFNYAENEKQIISHLLQPCSELFAFHTPLLLSRGNHDMRGSYARKLKQYLPFKNEYFYTYQTGPVFTVVLDTGEEEVTHPFDKSDAYREMQAKWFEQIAETDAFKLAKFRVVKMHIPPYYSLNKKGSNHCRRLFSPLFDKYNVDIVFSGHTHKYGVYSPIKGKHEYAIIIGGGRYDGTRAIIKVKANEAEITAQILKEDGSSAGKLTIAAKQV